MKVLAIDASSKSTGVAVFDNMNLIQYKCLYSTQTNTFKRLFQMREKIISIWKTYRPDVVVMEDVLPQDVGHNQTVFRVLMYLQALIVTGLYEYCGVQKVQLYVASHWRKVCGIKTGRGVKRDSLKKASIQLVKNQFNVTANDDICDAICIGLAYFKQFGSAF